MKLWRELVIFYLGGMLYMALELAWRGWSHGSMFLLGGCCFWLIGQLDARHPRWPILLQMLCGTGIIVALELAGGLVLNRWLGLGIWDYSHMWGNILGQICPQFFLVWWGLCLIFIPMFDWLRWAVTGGRRPHYRLI